jgi:hypothetical protein
VEALAQAAADRVVELAVSALDVNALLDRVDMNAVLDRIDINRLLDRVDMNPARAGGRGKSCCPIGPEPAALRGGYEPAAEHRRHHSDSPAG